MHCGSRGFDHWRRLAHELAWASCDPSFRPWTWADDEARRARRFAHRRGEPEAAFGGAGLGVRRPLRFLADRLDLDEGQLQALARVLERLKLERAQAELDLRRAAAELADAFEAESFGRDAAERAASLRAAAAQRVQEALARALEELHAQLAPEQRGRLAALVRAGVIRL
ncbi:MAG TPA: Spy/CpxP family protein refolding chaperone [Myxococcota bacterium]|nr:Spy/CpxP family protein refolding chaperone [Myxococcota bacterium]